MKRIAHLRPKRIGSWLQLAAVTALIGLVVLHSSPLSDIASVAFGPSHGAAAATANVYGFSTSLDTIPADQLNAKLAAMKATGARAVRFDISWATVQPKGPTSYDWSAYDRIFAALAANNMQAVGVIDFTPTWARPADCTGSKMCPPANPDQYGAFAAAVAARYQSDGATDWEIWNEPNIAFRFHPAANPALYTEMLKAAYTDIKKVEPASVVITGGTAPSETDAADLSPVDFLKAIYAYGGRGYFDAVAAHPYTYPNSPADGLPDAWQQMSTMHQVMVTYGDGAKKIWITEFGAPTNGPDIAGDHVTEAKQAQILTDAIRIFRSYSWSGPFFWYDFQDDGTSTNDSQNFYGLVRADGSRKPAYAAWVNAIKQYQ